MHTTERKTEIVATIEATRKKAAAITTNATARQTIFENLQYLDGAASHLFAELDRTERDSEQILDAIRQLAKHVEKHTAKWKEEIPPAEG